MNLEIMRARLRRDLHDEDSQDYRWTDDELNRHIDRAVREFSRACPREQKATIPTSSGSRDISIAGLTDVVIIYAVEYPVDRFPRSLPPFSVYETTITLLGTAVPDGSNCYVYYGKLHTLDSQSSTIPAQHEDLVAAGAAAYAATEWALYAVNRVNVGGQRAPDDFLKWAQNLIDCFKAGLKRLRSRIRTGTLYESGSPES
jgi:hypothetical protein